MSGDFNELRVHDVLVDEAGAVTAVRVEAVWGTDVVAGEPTIWSRAIFVVAALGSLAEVAVGDRLELRPALIGTGAGASAPP